MAEIDFSEIAKLNERFNKDPKSKIFVQLADAYRKNNMIDEAQDVLNKGLQYHPQYSLAYLIQGKCFFARRMFTQARESFEKVLSFDPQNIVALRKLAQIYETLKDETEQISVYKGILAIDPLDTAVKEKLDQLERLQMKSPIYTVAMAQEYERQQKFSEALKIYEYLFSIDPTDLILQQKVSELKKKVGKDKEEKKIEEEKIEGLQLETYFQPEDLVKKEETTTTEPSISSPVEKPEPAETQEKPVEQATEKKEEFIASSLREQLMSDVGEQQKQPKETEKVEEVLPLDDFLAEEAAQKPAETTEAPTVQREEQTEVPETSEVQEPQKIEELFTETEKAQIEEEAKMQQLPEEEKPPIEKSVEKETLQVKKLEEQKTAPPSETPKPKEKKPKEEDYQSFNDWLSGLIK